jgi:hypothetical protein
VNQYEEGVIGMRLRWWIALAVTICFIIGIWWTTVTSFEEYARFERPDGRYHVVVMRREIRPAMMPGQSGDAPGVVRLYDQQGRLMQETDVDMVQRVDRVYWEDKRISIKLIADWPLPD